MTRVNGAARAEESAWACEQVRFTLFHQPGSVLASEGVWAALTGQQPDTSVGKPKTKEWVEIGEWAGGQLVLHGLPQAGRTDWLLSPLVESDPTWPRLPSLLTPMSELVTRWVTDRGLPGITRAACGLVGLLSVPNPEVGYQRVSDYLPFDVDRSESCEFLYQINRRRKSQVVDGLDINRLMKWGVARVQKARLMYTDMGLAGMVLPDTEGDPFVRADLDINTVPKPGADIPPDRLLPLIEELVDLAREVIRDGDVP